jgi:hypothetical protein
MAGTVVTLPVTADETIIQGATYRRSWVWTRDGVPVDMTGWLGRMQVRADYKSAEVLLELTTDNGGMTLGADGSITLYASDETTAAMQSAGRYDIELEMPDDGDVIRWRQGKMGLSPEVTRD